MPKPSVTCQASLIYYSSKSLFDIALKSLKILLISKNLYLTKADIFDKKFQKHLFNFLGPICQKYILEKA